MVKLFLSCFGYIEFKCWECCVIEKEKEKKREKYTMHSIKTCWLKANVDEVDEKLFNYTM